MNNISPLAYIHPEAKLGDNNNIGPFCFIDKDTVLGDNNNLLNSVTTSSSPEQASQQNLKTSSFAESTQPARLATTTAFART